MYRKSREILGIRQTPFACIQLRPDLLTAVAEIAEQNKYEDCHRVRSWPHGLL